MRKPALFVLLALAAGAFALAVGSDPVRIRAWIAALAEWRSGHETLLWALYFVAYVVATALSLPVAIWMTLGAGALFGFLGGSALVAVAATAGATVAFLLARFLLADAVRARLGDRLGAVTEGLGRDGPFYLFTLRLIPVVPFFAVNLLMGLTSLPARTFAWVSFLGMLPATLIYVNAGTQLASVRSPADVLSPGLAAGLVALGLFPWAARAAIGIVRRRRLYGRWTRPARFDRNLVVIGAGATGLVAAYIAAAVRAKVTLVEADAMGGDCLNTGCVPSKAIIRSAKLAHQMRHADRYGLAPVSPEIPFRAVMERVQATITRIAPNDSVERYTSLGVEVVRGHARLSDPWTVTIDRTDGQAPLTLTTRAIVIATGARPSIPPIPGLSDLRYLTSETLWTRLASLDACPGRVVVLGGGPIGCELSQALARLGSKVALVQAGPRLLSKEDPEAAEIVASSLTRDGVDVLVGHRAVAAGAEGDGGWIEVESGSERRRIPFDELLVAVGRTARLEGYGLEDLGIRTGKVIETNDYLETVYPNIFAAGDVAGPFQLTNAGAHQAWYAAVNALFGGVRKFRTDYRSLPSAVFTDPEVARVGLTEAEAAGKGQKVEITRHPLRDLDRAVADSATEGFVKVLTVPGSDRILGATIVGEHAGDLIAELALAIRHRIGLNGILSTVHAYPTLAEANKYAAGAWRKAHVSPRVLSLLDRFHGWRRG